MRDAMTVITAIVLAICGLTYWAECRADYVLQLVVGTGEDAEVVSVDIYRHEKQCRMVLNQYRLGKAVYGEALERPIDRGGCVPCDEFPEMCRSGI